MFKLNATNTIQFKAHRYKNAHKKNSHQLGNFDFPHYETFQFKHKMSCPATHLKDLCVLYIVKYKIRKYEFMRVGYGFMKPKKQGCLLVSILVNLK